MINLIYKSADIAEVFLDKHFGYFEGYLGNFERDGDGYFYYWPSHYRQGYWSAALLQALADKLNELNKAWDEQVKKDLAK